MVNNKEISRSWTLIQDPCKRGAFKPGTKFADNEVAYMLRYHSFTTGTILQYKDGRQFQVVKVKDGLTLIGKRHTIKMIRGRIRFHDRLEEASP